MKRKLIIGIHVLLLAFVVGYFWTQSRYPALDNKAYYGDYNQLTGLSFDQVIAKRADDPWANRVYASTINWYYTNWKGMTFGLIFASLILSLFGFLRFPQFRNRWLSSISGAFFGAPLGVCVNCATPIGQGLEKSGLKPEFVLASTLSSPTLNIVVISMLITNFPLHLVILKLLATALLVFLIIPLIGPKNRKLAGAPEAALCLPIAEPVSYLGALRMFTNSLWKSSAKILMVALPLMLLSGLLGAVAIESINLEGWGRPSFIKLLGISIIGTALPVPMTFDVVLTHKLLESEMPTSYVTALLVTLGSFSIYPFLVFGRTYSWKFVCLLAISVATLGAATGFAAQKLEYRIALFNESRFLTATKETNSQFENVFRTIIAGHCTGIGLAKDECILSSISKIASLGNFSDLCTAVEAPELTRQCGYIVKFQRDHLTIDQCSKEATPDDCMMAFFRGFKRLSPDVAPENSCFKQAAAEPICNEIRSLIWAARNASAKTCFKKIITPLLKENCVMASAVTAWDRFGLPSARFTCRKLSSSASRDECMMNIFVAAEDSDGCSEAGERRIQCWMRVVLAERNDRVTEDSLCTQLPESDRSKCHEIAGSEIASYLIAREIEVRKLSKVSLNLQNYQASAAAGSENTTSSSQSSKSNAWGIYPQASRVESKAKDFLVTSSPFHPRNAQSAQQFERLWLHDLGIRRSPVQSWEGLSFSRGFGISSGDINGDGWPDLVIGEPDGVGIYLNHEGKYFDRLEMPKMPTAIIPVNVALADFNNDGLDDLYIANFDGRIFIIENDGHGFSSGHIHELPLSSRGWAVGAAFGDFNKDGYLDIFIGNTGAFAPNERNYLTDQYLNEVFLGGPDFEFKKVPWDDSRGATLSVLASDINGDGNLDLLEGNDFSTTDYVWLGDGKGHFKKVLKSDHLIPTFARASMGFDTADFDNDLKLDIFSSGNGHMPEANHNYCQTMKADGLDDFECRQVHRINKAISLQTPLACDRLPDNHHRMECYSGILADLAHRMHSPETCARIPDEFQIYKNRCLSWFEVAHERREEKFEDIAQKFSGNVLLRGLGNGKFEEVAKARGIENSHWAWTSKFADLDNDGWQDLYSVNSRTKFASMTPKVLFKNDHGVFKAATDSGLEDLYDTTSFIFIDYDLDGDLDVISNGILVPHRLFRNNLQSGNSLSFSFIDHKGNRAGIGNQLIIRYKDATGKPTAQMRELKLGGGYASYDPKVLHFGLGNVNSVDSVEVRWSTGQTTVLKQTFPAGRHYVIKRL